MSEDIGYALLVLESIKGKVEYLMEILKAKRKMGESIGGFYGGITYSLMMMNFELGKLLADIYREAEWRLRKGVKDES